MMKSLAQVVSARLEALGRISDEPGQLTRLFCSPAMRRANCLVNSWMRQAGLATRRDAIGNLIGHYPAAPRKGKNEKTLLLGSHLDTVRNAGKFDGPLGVLTGIACIQRLHQEKVRLPFAVDVAAFGDEEGVRYHKAYLGSTALAGTFDKRDLKREDADGISMAAAIRAFGGNPDAVATARLNPARLLGYIEVHIEQGPLLELKKVPVGVVTGISGQTRAQLMFQGRAAHAGTTPMHLRRDALCAAAQFINEVESMARRRSGLVATVGAINAFPGVSNVIPSQTRFTLDVRHNSDTMRRDACAELRIRFNRIGALRKLQVDWQTVSETASVDCDPHLSTVLCQAVRQHQKALVRLPSGAGHDAAALAAIIPVAMLFVRCKGGVSHHPNESASQHDIGIAIDVLGDFLQRLADSYE
jgi:allantoate deiminase